MPTPRSAAGLLKAGLVCARPAVLRAALAVAFSVAFSAALRAALGAAAGAGLVAAAHASPAALPGHAADPATLDAAPGTGLAGDALASLVRASGDAAGRPFAIVDKRLARIAVYRADGSLAGSSAALLGRDRGDHIVPGVGERAQTGQLLPGDATTPAGRFESRPGSNRGGEDVVWLDWDAALAIHRVRNGASLPNRLQRLATATPEDNRITAGCVVLPLAFYEAVVLPVLGRQRGVVYVLPDNGDARALLRLLRSSGL